MKNTTLIKDFNEKDLMEECTKLGYPKFHGSQLFKWLFKEKCSKYNEMSDIPTALQKKLKDKFFISSLAIYKQQYSKKDDTVKFLLQTIDNEFIETVSIIDGDRHTICLSSQIGCNVDCDFCATGKMGLKRNLSVAEIIDQFIIISKSINKKVTNIVFMGMGEPFLNYNNVLKSCDIFTHTKAFNLSAKRITISTAGILTKIKLFFDEEHKYKLAISLNASNNLLRDKIMPINSKWTIEDLISIVKNNQNKYNQIIMFEYVLLKDLNDSSADAMQLANLLKGVTCKINLIPFNEIDGKYKRPTLKKINLFSKILHEHRNNYRVFIRWSKGEDINAACGQLATNINEKYS